MGGSTDHVTEKREAQQLFKLEIGDGVATVVMNRAPVNAMSEAWVAAFNALLDDLQVRSDWSVLHLRSNQRAFCAGADLKEMRQRLATPDGIDAQIDVVRGYQELFARIEALDRVSLAEIGTTALGGGFELALACDLRIAAHEAKLGLPEARLGLLPGAGGTQRLTRLCGRSVALRLILGAEVLDGSQAAQLGLVQWSTPLADLPDTAAGIARRIAALPGHAVAAAKLCISAADTPGEAGFTAELDQTRALMLTDRTKSLVAAFLDRAAR